MINGSAHPQGDQNKAKNATVVWIVSKKVHDMVSQTWIRGYLGKYIWVKIFKKIISKAMKN